MHIEASLNARTAYTLSAYPAEDGFADNVGRLTRFVGEKVVAKWLDLFHRRQYPTLVAELLNFYDQSYSRSLQKNYAAAFLSAPIIIDPNDARSLSAAAQTINSQFGAPDGATTANL